MSLQPCKSKQKDEIIKGLGQGGRRKNTLSSKVQQLEAKLATQKALVEVRSAKIKAAPTAASAKVTITNSMATDNVDAKEADLYKLALSLNSMSVNDGDAPFFYHLASAANAQANRPILDSGASTSFVTDDTNLTSPRPHRTSIATENGQKSFTKSMGK